jgi:hypothetical protein
MMTSKLMVIDGIAMVAGKQMTVNRIEVVTSEAVAMYIYIYIYIYISTLTDVIS